jgi:hypothetical protein
MADGPILCKCTTRLNAVVLTGDTNAVNFIFPWAERGTGNQRVYHYNSTDEFNAFSNLFSKMWVVGMHIEAISHPDPPGSLSYGSGAPTVEIATYQDSDYPIAAPVDLANAKDYSLNIPLTKPAEAWFPVHRYIRQEIREGYVPINLGHNTDSRCYTAV